MSEQTYNKSKVVESFSQYFKKLICILNTSIPTNSDMYDTITNAKHVIFTAIEREPEMVIEDAGEYIYKFREEITNNKLDELFNSIDDENSKLYKCINEAKDKVGGNNKSMSNIITCMNTVWNNYNEKEKKKLNKLLKYIISEYSKYLLC